MAGNPILANEINTDPLGRGYAGMTDAQVAANLNIVYRTRNRTSMTGDEVFQATVPAEYNALPDGSANNTTDDQAHWLAFCGRAEIDPFATANVQFVTSIFGGGSGTVAALNAARVENVSRGVELGLGTVGEGDVWDVRNG